MSLVVTTLAHGTLLLHILLITAIAVFTAQKLISKDVYSRLGINRLNKFLSKYRNELVFLQATVAMSGSLFMSNVLGWTPCFMCWLQRSIVYPIAVISLATLIIQYRGRFQELTPGIIDDMRDYLIPLLLVGIPIATYHTIYRRFEQFGSAGCSITQVSCATEHTFHFGYINTPVMSLTAMLVMLFLLWRYDNQ